MKTPTALLFEKQEYTVVTSSDGSIPEHPEKNSTMVICGDGTYLLRKNEIGRFVRQLTKHPMPALGDGPGEGSFSLSLPKIPASILRQQVSFYREVMKKHNNAEAYTMILWDREEKEYVVVCPKQKISRGSVQYDLGKEWSPERYLSVVSCHSHNTMAAFFSGTDDADEKGDMCYMVVGHLDRPVPTFRIRASVAGSQIKFLELNELFSMDEEDWNLAAPTWEQNLFPFPKDWMSKLNVEANYVSIHQLQGGSARESFRYGAPGYDTKFDAPAYSWPTTRGAFNQLDFFEESPSAHTSNGRASIRKAAQKLHRSITTYPIVDVLSKFFQDVVDAGFAEELVMAYDDMISALDLTENPLSTELDLSRDEAVGSSQEQEFLDWLFLEKIK